MAWEDPDEHSFFVPPQARWSALQQTASNIGESLNLACAKLEEFNTDTLEGVLLAMDFNDPNKLGNTKNRDTVLGKLVQHFSRLNLRNDALADPDMLGRAYEYLIERFADDAGKKGGEFFTPFEVTGLLVRYPWPRVLPGPHTGGLGFLRCGLPKIIGDTLRVNLHPSRGQKTRRIPIGVDGPPRLRERQPTIGDLGRQNPCVNRLCADQTRGA